MMRATLRYPARVLLPYRCRRAIKRKLKELKHPLRVAVIGCGEIAPTHVSSFEETGEATVVAVCDRSPAALKRAIRWPEIKTYRDYRQMLAEQKPDVVSVCTWADSHLEMVTAAVAAGVKAVLCEKPLALTMTDVEQMVAICRKAGVKLAGGHQYRFHANFLRGAEVVRSGSLGELTAVRAHIVGTLADNGPHMMDALRLVLGDPEPQSMLARCERSSGRFYQGYPAEDGARGEIQFAGGVRAEFRSGSLAPGFFSISVEGRDGSVTAGPNEFVLAGRARSVAEHPADYRLRQFRECVEWVKGKRSEYAADERPSIWAVEMVLGAYESARVGGPVALPLGNRGEIIHELYPDMAPPAPSDCIPMPDEQSAPPVPLAMDGGSRAAPPWFSMDPAVGREEIRALKRVIRSRTMNYVEGKEVKALADEFAQYYGSPHAVASSSGTAAIHVALGAINPEPCDEIITTPITDLGTVIPILSCNCIPVFADVDPQTGNLTAESIARKITPRTRAVIVVHLFGRPADLDGITALLKQKNIPLIEDCCQAHDGEYRGRKVGTFGDFGCFSLQQSKQITCGDGGITLVNRPEMAERATLFADKGWSRQHGRRHLFLGMNYRMTELQAAVAREQLKKLPRLVAQRRETAALFNELLANIEGIIPPIQPPQAKCSWWIYDLAIDEEKLGVSSDAFCDALVTEGVLVNRRYLPGPVFGYEVLAEQKTYGTSRYPFSAVPDFQPPRLEDYPGFITFQDRQMIIPWSHNVGPQHVRGIAAAVGKLAAYCRNIQRARGEADSSRAPALVGN